MTPPTTEVYSGRSSNAVALTLLVAAAVPFVGLAWPWSDGSWATPGFLAPLAVVVAALVLTVATCTSVRSTAGPGGVTVHFGLFGWPRFHYPSHRIALATAIELPASTSAWGMYWSPRNGLMLTLRPGPALRLELTNGRRVTVSTPDPVQAVRVLGGG